MKSGAPLSSSNCVTTPSSYTTIPVGSNLMGGRPRPRRGDVVGHADRAGLHDHVDERPAAHAGTSTDAATFDYAYVVRPDPPSIGAFEP